MTVEQKFIDAVMAGIIVGFTSAAIMLGIAEIIYIIKNRKKQRR